VFDPNTTPGNKPSLADSVGTWGTNDNTKLDLPGFQIPSPIDGVFLLPFEPAPSDGNAYDNVAIYIFGFFRAPISGTYVFTSQSDDGFQMTINPGNRIIDQPGRTTNGSGVSSPIELVGGQKYSFDALWSNGTGALGLAITDIRVDGLSLPNDYGIPIFSCFSKEGP
jgi:hypothetical protein